MYEIEVRVTLMASEADEGLVFWDVTASLIEEWSDDKEVYKLPVMKTCVMVGVV